MGQKEEARRVTRAKLLDSMEKAKAAECLFELACVLCCVAFQLNREATVLEG